MAFVEHESSPHGPDAALPIVQLWHAPLPLPVRPVAVHHWFVVEDPAAGRQRWEVWQNRAAGGTSWGHVHRDLMAPERGVGGGPPALAAEWRGAAAGRLRAALARSGEYPYRERYRAWPGPNSNTYAAWVLEQAAIEWDFDPRAVGKDYRGARGFHASRAPGRLCLETPLTGLLLARGSGLELHLLGLTLGCAVRPFRLKTPFGWFPGRRNQPAAPASE